jgi:Ca2+-binding RTX toxin-like protein
VVEDEEFVTDTVRSSVSFVLPARVEDLILTGAANLNGSGGAENNWLYGNAGNNVLTGAGGSDVLIGGGGSDRLIGGAGGDVLAGGAGADIFLFNAPLGSEQDRVEDFSTTDDLIHLSRAVFTKLPALGVLAASAFHVGSSAHDGDDRIIFNPMIGVFYDPDGTGNASQVLIANFDNQINLTYADIIVVG